MTARKINQFFPVLPNFTSWEDYTGQLAMYYGQEPFAMASEDNWQETAASIASTPTFSSYAIPDATSYSSWQEWADDFTTIVNGKTR